MELPEKKTRAKKSKRNLRCVINKSGKFELSEIKENQESQVLYIGTISEIDSYVNLLEKGIIM